MNHFTVFILAIFVGWQVVWNVTPALHTPLMSVTNAISGIIVIGALLKIDAGSSLVVLLAAISLLIASVNISGGFPGDTQNAADVSERYLNVSTGIITSAYIAASVLFILSLARVEPSGARSARQPLRNPRDGDSHRCHNLITPRVGNYALVIILMVSGGGIGALVAARVQMTAMPQLVALLHSFVGLAAVLVGFGTFLDPTVGYFDIERTIHNIEIYLGVLIGAVTFTGSVIAFGKLQGIINSRPLTLPGRHLINIAIGIACLWFGWHFISMGWFRRWSFSPLIIATVLALIFGAHMVLAIGGADMPVVISMLNSYSGWAAAATGFMLANDLLIVTGALVGSSGAILSYIMCRAMNRQFSCGDSRRIWWISQFEFIVGWRSTGHFDQPRRIRTVTARSRQRGYRSRIWHGGCSRPTSRIRTDQGSTQAKIPM